MSINVTHAGLDQKTTETGKPISGSEGGWLKALEKAHFEKQRESMQATDSSNTDLSGKDRGVNDQGQETASGFPGQDAVFPNVPEGHQAELAPNQADSKTLISGTGNTHVLDLLPVKSEQISGAYIPAPPVTKADVVQGEQSHRETGGGARPQHVVQKTDFSAKSVKLFPVESGVELVIRSRKDSEAQLASTIKAVQTFLAMNSQKLSLVRVNGEVLTTPSARADSPEIQSEKRMLTINKVY